MKQTRKYEDIIGLPHPVSPTRKRMSMLDRAAQFSPFAALTGFDAAIQETGRLTDDRIDLAFEGSGELDRKLRVLAEHIQDRPEVRISHFVPDKRKAGGAYMESAGRVKKLDALEKWIQLEDGTILSFDRIYDIRGTVFAEE